MRLTKNVFIKKICPSARATDNPPLKQHADGTCHRYRGRRTYETAHTRDGVEQVSISSRQQWPERPIRPWPCVHQSSELLPATAPRAARGRINAREAVGCIGLGSCGLAPSLLVSPGDREDHLYLTSRLTHKRNNFLQPFPPARSNNKLPMRTYHEPRQYTNFGRQMARRNTENEIIIVWDFPTCF